MHTPIFAPVIALVLWTFVMEAWLYATRIPAVSRLGLVYDPLEPNEAFMARMPPRVRWKADNHNNLTEQPPLFYAVAIVLALLGAGGGAPLAGLGLRRGAGAHSLLHALLNIVMLRFALFALASAILLVMAVLAAVLRCEGGPGPRVGRRGRARSFSRSREKVALASARVG